jgi:hypothetical protein
VTDEINTWTKQDIATHAARFFTECLTHLLSSVFHEAAMEMPVGKLVVSPSLRSGLIIVARTPCDPSVIMIEGMPNRLIGTVSQSSFPEINEIFSSRVGLSSNSSTR